MAQNPRIISSFTHEGRVEAIAYSPDGDRIATVCEDMRIRLFAVATGAKVAEWVTDRGLHSVEYAPSGAAFAVTGRAPGFPGGTTVLVYDATLSAELWRFDSVKFVRCHFSPDSTKALTHDDGLVLVKDAMNGSDLVSWVVSGNQRVRHAAFSHDGSLVAVATGGGLQQGEIVIIEAASGLELRRLGRPSRVDHVCFSPDDKFVGFGALDEVGTLNRSTGAVQALPNASAPHTGTSRDVAQMAFSHDGSLIGVVSTRINGTDWDIRVLDPISLAAKQERELGFSALFAFSPDTGWAMTAEQGSDARVWDAASGANVFDLALGGDITDLAFGPDSTLAGVANDKVVTAFELPVLERTRVTHGGAVQAVAFSDDGTLLATAGADGKALVFDMDGVQRTPVTHSGAVVSVLWVPGKPWVITASADKTARVVDTVTSTEKARTSHSRSVNAIAVDAGGSRVASGGDDGLAMVVELATGDLRAFEFEEPVRAVGLDSKGSRLAIGCEDNTATIINMVTSVRTQLGHDDVVTTVRFSPDGARLATACDDGLVRVYDVASGQRLLALRHDAAVRDVDFDASGSRIVTASDDRSARVFLLTDGTELRKLPHDGAVVAATFTPSGTLVVTASADKTARVFRAGDGRQLAQLRPRRCRAWGQRRPDLFAAGHGQRGHDRSRLPAARLTSEGGSMETWSRPRALPEGWFAPSIAFDGAGRAVAAYTQVLSTSPVATRVAVADMRAADEWVDGFEINSTEGDIPYEITLGVGANGTAAACVTSRTSMEATAKMRHRVVYRPAGGRTWEDPVEIVAGSEIVASDVGVHVAPNGLAVVVAARADGPQGDSQVGSVFVSAHPANGTWTIPQQVSTPGKHASLRPARPGCPGQCHDRVGSSAEPASGIAVLDPRGDPGRRQRLPERTGGRHGRDRARGLLGPAPRREPERRGGSGCSGLGTRELQLSGRGHRPRDCRGRVAADHQPVRRLHCCQQQSERRRDQR